MKWHENREQAEEKLAELEADIRSSNVILKDLNEKRIRVEEDKLNWIIERDYIKVCLEHNMDCVYQCDCDKYFETWDDFSEHYEDCNSEHYEDCNYGYEDEESN